MGSISISIMLEPSILSMNFVYYCTLMYIVFYGPFVFLVFLLSFPLVVDVNGIIGVFRICGWCQSSYLEPIFRHLGYYSPEEQLVSS
jgi:hypothetical protein